MGGRRDQAAVGGEKVKLELVEGNLGQIFDDGGDLTGPRIWVEGAEEL